MDRILQSDNRGEFLRRSAHCLTKFLLQRTLADVQLIQQVLYPDITLAFMDERQCFQYQLIGLSAAHSVDQELLDGSNALPRRFLDDKRLYKWLEASQGM